MTLIDDALENMFYVHLDADFSLLEDTITKISDQLDEIQSQYIDTTSIVYIDSTTAIWAECEDSLACLSLPMCCGRGEAGSRVSNCCGGRRSIRPPAQRRA